MFSLRVVAFGFLLIWLALPNAAQAKYKVLYTFCSQTNCADGQGPNGGLIADADGDLYGATNGGGAHSGGTIFELVKEKRGWRHKILYNFCAEAGCADGTELDAPLIIDISGNLYGTTVSGGARDLGTIFELKKGKKGSWTLVILQSFCTESGCPDGGGFPSGLSYFGQQSGAAYDGKSPLYGATSTGGRHEGGVIYQLTHKGRDRWAERVVYSFCARHPDCADGTNPLNAPIIDASSNIFGTTGNGGSAQGGTVFKLVPSGQKDWNESLLYSFCSQANCADGSFPEGPLAVDGNGNLFGMTAYHGSGISRCSDGEGCGVIYEVSAGGAESTLYQFCTLSGCADGTGPMGGLTIDETGKLYGVTLGVDGPGTLFSFGRSLKVLHTFCSWADCSDGYAPYDVTLIRDAVGDLFGTTGGSGDNGVGGGVVFEWVH